MEVIVVWWLSSLGLDTAIQVHTLDYAVCISHSAYILGKYVPPAILFSTMAK